MACSAVILVLAQAGDGRLGGYDRQLLSAMRSGSDGSVPIGPVWLPSAARDITSLGSHGALILIASTVAGALAASGRRREGARIVVAAAGAMVLSATLKALFDHPRPPVTALTEVFTASFPSGHALLAAAIYPTITAVIGSAMRRRARMALTSGALVAVGLVGASRVYLGVHYPSEVLAGWVVGATWALCCALIFAQPAPTLGANGGP